LQVVVEDKTIPLLEQEVKVVELVDLMLVLVMEDIWVDKHLLLF
jgi:hypothetical protein